MKSEKAKSSEGFGGGHAHMLPIKGKRRLRLDAIQRRFNALKRRDTIVPERMISDAAYIKLRVVKPSEKKAVIGLKKAA